MSQYSQEVKQIFEAMLASLDDNSKFNRSLLDQLNELYQSQELHQSEKLSELIDNLDSEAENE